MIARHENQQSLFLSPQELIDISPWGDAIDWAAIEKDSRFPKPVAATAQGAVILSRAEAVAFFEAITKAGIINPAPVSQMVAQARAGLSREKRPPLDGERAHRSGKNGICLGRGSTTNQRRG